MVVTLNGVFVLKVDELDFKGSEGPVKGTSVHWWLPGSAPVKSWIAGVTKDWTESVATVEFTVSPKGGLVPVRFVKKESEIAIPGGAKA